MLSDLQDKAQTELDDSRHAESSATHNFALLVQSLQNKRAQGEGEDGKKEISTAFEAEGTLISR